jgi:hypothetical protein
VFVPLLSIIDDAAVREAVMGRAREHHQRRQEERAESIEARVLTILRHLFANVSGVGVAVGDVTDLFVAHYSSDTLRPMTPRWMGTIIRTKLGLRTQKSNGRFVVPTTEQSKLARLYDTYGVGEEEVAALEEKLPDDLVWERTDHGDMGTSGTLR